MTESTAIAKKLDFDKLLSVDEAKAERMELVKANPFLEITNTATYDEAKRRRSALKAGRTTINNKEKEIASAIRKFRIMVGNTAADIVSITHGAELKQQEEIDKWEAGIAERRAERERKAEEERQKLKKGISDFVATWIEMLDGVEFKEKEELHAMKAKIEGFTGEFGEFQAEFNEAKEKLIKHADAREEKLDVEERERKVKEEEERLAKIQAEIAEKERKAAEKKEKAEAEKLRKKMLPEKERLLEVLSDIELPEVDAFEIDQVAGVYASFVKEFEKLKKKYADKVKKLGDE